MTELKKQMDEVREQINQYERPGLHASKYDAGGQMSEREVLDKVVELKYHDLPRLQAMYDNLAAQNDAEEHNLFTEVSLMRVRVLVRALVSETQCQHLPCEGVHAKHVLMVC